MRSETFGGLRPSVSQSLANLLVAFGDIVSFTIHRAMDRPDNNPTSKSSEKYVMITGNTNGPASDLAARDGETGGITFQNTTIDAQIRKDQMQITGQAIMNLRRGRFSMHNDHNTPKLSGIRPSSAQGQRLSHLIAPDRPPASASNAC